MTALGFDQTIALMREAGEGWLQFMYQPGGGMSTKAYTLIKLRSP